MIDQVALTTLVAKEQIRELVALYSRAIDRQDLTLCRLLFTADAWDTHGENFDGSADDFIKYLERALVPARYTGHHICNHLISVNGEIAEGEVYAIAYHVLADGKGALYQDVMNVRYLDHYRKENGRWRFARRFATFDCQSINQLQRPDGNIPDHKNDASYTKLSSRLFARGARD